MFRNLLMVIVLTSLTVILGAEEIEKLEIAPVWSGHPVGFSLYTHEDYQFVGFYDADRWMTLAKRKLDSTEWEFKRLDSQVGWDSHNYIAMTIDEEGYIHVSGNMHGDPLVYFRSTRPLDIQSLERIPTMVGSLEDRVTYPRFFTGTKGELIFTYRDGGSGQGNQIYNVYDPGTRTWKRLLDTPLIDGEGNMNAYLEGPSKGPDGMWHAIWVWRDTPDCSTNHDICYMRSPDLRVWEDGRGTSLTLPITYSTSPIAVPIPPKGGLINGGVHLGFDSKNRPILSYHKYDSDGITQAYVSRLEDGVWLERQISDWEWRWDFHGNGSIDFQVKIGRAKARPDGKLHLSYTNAHHGKGFWILDEESLQQISDEKSVLSESKENKDSIAESLESGIANAQVNWISSAGKSHKGVQYRLRWESRPPNRDRPHPDGPSDPTMLSLYTIRR